MIHVLPIVPVESGAFLVTVGRIVGAVQVDQDVGGDPIAFPLAQVEVAQGDRQPVADPPVHGIFQARERRLTRQISPGLRQAAADQLEQRVGAQRVGVVLIFIPAGDLKDALAHQRGQRVPDRTAPPLGHAGGKRGTDPSAASASLNQGNPPSEVRRPQSKLAANGNDAGTANRIAEWQTAACGLLLGPGGFAPTRTSEVPACHAPSP